MSSVLLFTIIMAFAIELQLLAGRKGSMSTTEVVIQFLVGALSYTYIAPLLR